MSKKVKRKIHLGRRVLGTLDLPEELLGSVTKITMLGQECALVENHAGIYSYSEKEICLLTAGGSLKIKGCGLVLRELSSERVYVCGKIEGFQYA